MQVLQARQAAPPRPHNTGSVPERQVPPKQQPLQVAGEQATHAPATHRASMGQARHESPRVPHATSLFPATQKLPEQHPAQSPHVEGGLQNPSTQRPEQV